MLRQFLYIDHDLVREFLSAIEGGLFDESRELKTRNGKRGVEGKAAVGPISAGIQRGTETQAESEAVVRQTAASEFDRLYRSLECSGLQVYDAIDQPLDELPIHRRDIIEVDARIRVSGIHALLDLLRKFGEAAPVIQQFGSTQQVDPEMVEGIKAITALTDNAAHTSVIATVLGESNIAIAMDLRSAGVKTEHWDIEATIMLKVMRVLRPGQTELVGDPFGGLLRALSEAKRMEMLAGLRADDVAQFGIGESEIRYPAIVGAPIAIYR